MKTPGTNTNVYEYHNYIIINNIRYSAMNTWQARVYVDMVLHGNEKAQVQYETLLRIKSPLRKLEVYHYRNPSLAGNGLLYVVLEYPFTE